MARKAVTGSDWKEAVAIIGKILQDSREPLSASGISKKLPFSLRTESKKLTEILHEQVRLGTIYEWLPMKSQKRYWTQAVEPFARARILGLVSERVHTRRQLKDALKRGLFGCSETKSAALTTSLLKALLKEGVLFEHPPEGRQKAPRIAAAPPDPSLYLGKVEKEFRGVCKKLEGAGISPAQILESLSRILRLPAEKSPSRGKESPAGIDARAPHAAELQRTILHRIFEIEPAAPEMALVSIRELRSSLDLPKNLFDEAILDLSRQGKIFLHRHAFPAEMSREEEEHTVSDGRGNYYMGLVLRSKRFPDV